MDETREQLRQQSSNQFNQKMKQMIDEAQKLEKNQQELNQQVSPSPNQPQVKPKAKEDERGGLRPEQTNEVEKKNTDQMWKQQKDELNKLLEEMQKTVTEAESSEPLLAEQLYDSLKPMQRPNVAFRELSMGMSGDYLMAVEEGSTMVRIGSALFGPRA